jgi:hypothetical protein
MVANVISVCPVIKLWTANISVAEPVHFCAAPAPACQKFRLRLRLQLDKNFGSGSDHFPHICSTKIKNCYGFKKISCFLKPKTIIKRFFKVKSYDNFFLLQILYEKFRTFCNILYEFTYPEPEPGLKTWTPAPPKSGRSTGSGSATLANILNFLIAPVKVVTPLPFAPSK